MPKKKSRAQSITASVKRSMSGVSERGAKIKKWGDAQVQAASRRESLLGGAHILSSGKKGMQSHANPWQTPAKKKKPRRGGKGPHA